MKIFYELQIFLDSSSSKFMRDSVDIIQKNEQIKS